MDFAAILADDKTFTDDIEMTIGAEKVTLGQLRDLSKKQQATLTEQMNTLSRERNEVKELAVKAADLLSKAQPLADAGVTKQTEQRSTPEDYWDTDPLYEPVRKRLSPLENQIKEQNNLIAKQQSALEKAAFIFGKRMFREDYERSKSRLSGDKYKEYRNPDKLAQYAVDHQLVDEFGLPSVEKAVADITREDETERIKREAYDKGLEEGRVNGRMASMTRPGSAAGTRAGAKGKALDPSKNFEDLGDAVADDPDIMKALSQLGDLDPSLLQ